MICMETTMKKLMVVLMALLLGGQALAEEEKQAEESFFDSLRKKIEMLTPKKKLKTAKAVGGVRGAQADADVLYWKGEQDEQAIDADELASFDQAITLAAEGERDAAEAELNAFLEAYPDSRLREDAEQAIAMLESEAAPAVPAEDNAEGESAAASPLDAEAEPADAQ